ncbi:MAG: hypothetical protein IKF96_03770 [Eggerthellaceae bacterium]|nr:hypothetical protein [Eggerthellaceae bacterium]
MNASARVSAIEELHPLVPALYFAGALGFAMAAFQPVFLGLALLIGITYNAYLRGWREVLPSLKWQVPLALIIILINPIVGSQGRTVLFEIFGRKVALEKLLYGVCMGELLMATLAWFSCAARVMTAEKVTLLTGRVAPVVGTTLTMSTRLVPVFVRRTVCIDEVIRANTAAAAGKAARVDAAKGIALGVEAAGTSVEAVDGMRPGRSARGPKGWLDRLRNSVSEVSRRISVLMGWGMEDSLETADSMLCRGWGSGARHTSYKKYRFTATDACALAVVIALFAVACVGCVQVCGPFNFYPVMGPWAGDAWWAYVAYGVYLALPLILEGGAKLLWKR